MNHKIPRTTNHTWTIGDWLNNMNETMNSGNNDSATMASSMMNFIVMCAVSPPPRTCVIDTKDHAICKTLFHRDDSKKFKNLFKNFRLGLCAVLWVIMVSIYLSMILQLNTVKRRQKLHRRQSQNREGEENKRVTVVVISQDCENLV